MMLNIVLIILLLLVSIWFYIEVMRVESSERIAGIATTVIVVAAFYFIVIALA